MQLRKLVGIFFCLFDADMDEYIFGFVSSFFAGRPAPQIISQRNVKNSHNLDYHKHFDIT